MKWKLNIVDNARQVWKHFSTWALTTVAAIQILVMSAPELVLQMWGVLPMDIKDKLGQSVQFYVSVITALVAIWGLGGKFVKQKLEPKAPEPTDYAGHVPPRPLPVTAPHPAGQILERMGQAEEQK